MQYECTTENRNESLSEPENTTLKQSVSKQSHMEEHPTSTDAGQTAEVSKSEALRMVRERWPEAFRVSSPRPLKVGIHNEMKQTGEFPLPIIKSALKLFTSQERYLMSIKPGRSRIDLNGKPAGKVKLKEAVNAEITLFMRSETVRQKKQRTHVGQLRLVSQGSQAPDSSPELSPEQSETCEASVV
ncbi:ProQ/FinO family protein [Endozoicomonas lisbonensis]